MRQSYRLPKGRLLPVIKVGCRIGRPHDDDDDNMTWACEVAAMRLLKKCKKETLVALCNDFGIPTSGNKEKLAEDAAEQMHYETDEEEAGEAAD